MRRKRISWWLLFYLVLILGLHILPFGVTDLSRVQLGPFRLDHILHAAMFFPWMIVVWLYLNANHIEMDMKKGIFWLLSGVVLSAGTELIHYWLPYRIFNFSDMMFNVIGVLGGAVILWMGWARR